MFFKILSHIRACPVNVDQQTTEPSRKHTPEEGIFADEPVYENTSSVEVLHHIVVSIASTFSTVVPHLTLYH